MNDVRLNAEGSSPLTRGKQMGRQGISQRTRLIPAHAGKTSNEPPTLVKPRAHPRSRGENLKNRRTEADDEGSSPLTRGKRTGLRVGRPAPGLIPAHAGKTTAGRCRRGRQRAHPRSRGENLRFGGLVPPDAGSSPLTRGNRPRYPSPLLACGLIPAHAGKTWAVSATRPR